MERLSKDECIYGCKEWIEFCKEKERNAITEQQQSEDKHAINFFESVISLLEA